jgi:hypothetical protein
MKMNERSMENVKGEYLKLLQLNDYKIRYVEYSRQRQISVKLNDNNY